MKKPDGFWLWIALLVLMLAGGFLLLLYGLLPYEILKALGNSLARDGNLQRFSTGFYAISRLPSLVLAFACLGIGALLASRPEMSRRTLASGVRWIRQAAVRLRQDFHSLVINIRSDLPPRSEFFVLLAILAVAAFMRIALVNKAMEYDEAYTYSEFARHSLRQVVSDYHVPNNHVFHTILVWLSVRLFGDDPWAIRLPVLVAGLLLVIAVYVLGRKNYTATVGLVAAGGVAVFPALVLYSVNARGYMLLCLFTVLLLLLADYTRRNRSPAAWTCMVIVTALGFYTIPIMLYPFGMTVTWLLISGLAGDISPNYRGLRAWLAYLIGFGLCSALLTILFYLPIFQTNGLMTVFHGNRVVESLTLPVFLNKFPFQFDSGLDELLVGGVPHWVAALLLVGSLLSLVAHARLGHSKIAVQLAVLLFLIPVVLIQRPIILARVWLFLVVLLIIWSAAGLLGAVQLLLGLGTKGTAYSAALMLFVLLAAGAVYIMPYLANPNLARYPRFADAESVTRYLKDHLLEGDVVIVSNDEDAQYWYYFEYYHIPETYIRRIKTHTFRRALLISHPNPRRTIESVILQFGPDPGFLRMETIQQFAQVGDTLIYAILPNQPALYEAYGNKP